MAPNVHTAQNTGNSSESARPTEGQLRWAQFHHKRRAKDVRQRVELFWQTPTETNDVSGALPEDGNTTSENDGLPQQVRARRPKVSRGRRALLRVSRRNFQKRHDYISHHGYQDRIDADGNTGPADDIDSEEKDNDELLNAIFTNSRRRRRVRKYKKGVNPETERRLRNQFQEACHAMMMNLAAPARHSIAVPSKRWTRTAEHVAASHDFHYDDVHWGMRQANSSAEHNEADERKFHPLDRGASWMIHLPKKSTLRSQIPLLYYGHSTSEDGSEPTSEHFSEHSSTAQREQVTFNQLLEVVQLQLVTRNASYNAELGNAQRSVPRPAPKMRLRYFLPGHTGENGAMETNSNDLRMNADVHNADHFDRSSKEHESEHISDGMDAAPGSNLVPPPRRKEHRLAGSLKSQHMQDKSTTAAQHNPTVGQNGTVHRIQELFANQADPALQVDLDVTDGLCFACYSQRPKDSGGTSDFFEHIRTAENAAVSNTDAPGVTSVCLLCHDEHITPHHAKNDVLSHQIQQLVDGSIDANELRHQSEHDGNKSDVFRGAALSNLWERGRHSVSSAISGMNAIPEAQKAGNINPSNEDQHASPSTADLKARVARMSGRVGGFFSKKTPESGSSEDEDIGAIAAFRKSLDARRESGMTDDSSSLSSFRVLPGFRQVVQGLQQSSLKQKASPSRSSNARSSYGSSVLSYENYKDVHERTGRKAGSIIDTDDTKSDASDAILDARRAIGNLMLSPALLNKRLRQAIHAVEDRNWDQVSYLLSANPWLAEMLEVTTNQYLLHKVAFYGADSPACPDSLNETLLAHFPAAIHKFDQDGNVPLHLSSAAGNLNMIRLLGEHFPGGASVRNEDGMLPLHFTIATIKEVLGTRAQRRSEGLDSDQVEMPSPIEVIKTVLKFFPNAVAIPDNDGNLPLHIAAACLDGGVGVDVVYLLLDESDRQVRDPCGARFYNKVKMEDMNEMDSVATMSTGRETDSIVGADELIVHCNMVKNDMGETALSTAIKVRNDWEIIEAIASGPGGRSAALEVDSEKRNALHLLFDENFINPTAALSVLKIAPEAACFQNSAGMLPIECACMMMVPAEVILALVLVDLPVDVGNSARSASMRNGFGGSWWFLTCDCDDHYTEIVQQVVTLCTYDQVRELCFMKGGPRKSKSTVMSRATPICHQILTEALRFVGRFEFVGSSTVSSDPTKGLKVFDALDFGANGNNNENFDEGKRVLLSCYSREDYFLAKTASLKSVQLDPAFVEEVLTFAVNDGAGQDGGSEAQFCVSVERPMLTLDGVVAGMMKNDSYSQDPNLRKRYIAKIAAVLRLVAKALQHMHKAGVIHGDVCAEKCGKFEDSWKLTGRLEMQHIGQQFVYHEGIAFPPESVEESADSLIVDADDIRVAMSASLRVTPSIDIWGFGKLAYEVFAGKALVNFDNTIHPHEDVVGLLEVMEWNEDDVRRVFLDLLDVGIPESGADLIASCLLPEPSNRPASMDEILTSNFWKEMRRHRHPSKKTKHSAESAVSTMEI